MIGGGTRDRGGRRHVPSRAGPGWSRRPSRARPRRKARNSGPGDRSGCPGEGDHGPPGRPRHARPAGKLAAGAHPPGPSCGGRGPCHWRQHANWPAEPGRAGPSRGLGHACYRPPHRRMQHCSAALKNGLRDDWTGVLSPRGGCDPGRGRPLPSRVHPLRSGGWLALAALTCRRCRRPPSARPGPGRSGGCLRLSACYPACHWNHGCQNRGRRNHDRPDPERPDRGHLTRKRQTREHQTRGRQICERQNRGRLNRRGLDCGCLNPDRPYHGRLNCCPGRRTSRCGGKRASRRPLTCR